MATLQDFIDRYEKLGDEFNLFTAKSYPATDQMIKAYEEESGFQFSNDVTDFLHHFGNVIIEVAESVWPRPSEFEICPEWKLGYGFFLFGLSPNPSVPSWMSFEENYEDEFADQYGQCFFERSGNSYCAYIKGDVIHTRIEDDFTLFEGNYYDYLIQEIDELEKDYKQYILKE